MRTRCLLLKKSINIEMSKFLNEWSPSETTLDLIRLNGIADEQIQKSLAYLKNQSGLDNIDTVEGYDNWNAFFIMFCIKVTNSQGASSSPSLLMNLI